MKTTILLIILLASGWAVYPQPAEMPQDLRQQIIALEKQNLLLNIQVRQLKTELLKRTERNDARIDSLRMLQEMNVRAIERTSDSLSGTGQIVSGLQQETATWREGVKRFIANNRNHLAIAFFLLLLLNFFIFFLLKNILSKAHKRLHADYKTAISQSAGQLAHSIDDAKKEVNRHIEETEKMLEERIGKNRNAFNEHVANLRQSHTDELQRELEKLVKRMEETKAGMEIRVGLVREELSEMLQSKLHDVAQKIDKIREQVASIPKGD